MNRFPLLLSLACLLAAAPLAARDAAVPPLAPNPFKPGFEPGAEVTYRNPVLPGFYSDPSVIRVGEDYYLVTSTFEYFPGVPVFHSRDLVNWRQIGHAIHRPEQLPQGVNIFAATIRHHDGRFYMITTNVGRGGNFFVTATDPAGPWSDPVFIDVEGIDPDLFFDGDGKAYVISSTFELFEIDLSTGKLLSEGRTVWATTGGRYPEGPHIYRKDGWYYLMASEGGTEEAHSVTIARSNSIWGPYYGNPANPILAHANAAGQGNAIQGVGHADMVQAHDGSWWLMFHGYRQAADAGVYTPHHVLGRETCLAPVAWPKNAWPQVNGVGAITADMTAPTLPLQPFSPAPARIEFDQPLGLEWNWVQYPETERYSLEDRPGFLRLRGSAATLGGEGAPTFVGRRLQHPFFSAETELEFDPSREGEEAGITLLNNGTHFDLVVRRAGEARVAVARLQFGSVVHESEPAVLAPGPVRLRVEGERSAFRFSVAQGDSDYRELQKVSARYLSSETVGGFTGVYVGAYATGNGGPATTPADYDGFEYLGGDEVR